MQRKTPCLVANQARCFYTLLDLTLTIVNGLQGAFDDVMTDKGDTYIDCYSHLFLLVVK